MDHTEELVAEISRKFLSRIRSKEEIYNVDASGLHYRDLNTLLRALGNNGAKKIEVHGVYGQRYIGTGIDKKIDIELFGTPGNDLGAFMSGPRIVVHGNAQDCCGNTMDDGIIVVHGHVGDIAGYSMRGGKLFIQDDVGYRVGIHMKEYLDKRPVLVVGGTPGDFLGEYMAGGVILVLGLNSENKKFRARYVGTGMHGGVIFVRGEMYNLVSGVEALEANEEDMRFVDGLVREFCFYFGLDVNEVLDGKFTKITPINKRPYENLYAY
ncbi:hypothetical protein KEJ18_01715 [Candidatus Bathyarchaeota archaeon]|nr:hypothetical protein [Candidatus Bathyarchaeota archaeon]